MPRKKAAEKREMIPDCKYQDVLVSRFINGLMRRGKKSTAEKVFYQSLNLIAEKTKDDPLKIFKQAVSNVKPAIEVKSRRVGGATYQVPVEVSSRRQIALSIRWIVGNAKSRSGRSMVDKLTEELIDAYNRRGASIKKREDVHKMADANKAFAHYRW